MTDSSYAKVREIFHQVCDLDPIEQLEQIDTLCENDPATKTEVLRLLTALDDSRTLGESFADSFDIDVTMPQIEGYTLLSILGEGGMGTVYEAQQHNPSRRVSIKVVRFGTQDETTKRRFEREAQALARLKHPGIAQIYTTGTSSFGNRSFPYITLELVEGKPLLEYARSTTLDSTAKLELAYKLCEAVHYAHTQGVIHRDLKPSNILVEPTGQPKILDFGIARITDSEAQALTLQTHAGQILGTAAYMSPEQALGKPDQVDERTDIYSLGVLIYELLTGRRPHQIDNLPIPDAIRTIREDEPTRISTVNSRFKGDLDTIVAKALEGDPGHRYQTAHELGQDIKRFLKSEPIVARPTSVAYRVQKFTKRNKAVVFGIASVFVVLIIGLIGTSFALKRESQARKETTIALVQSQSSTEFLESILLGLEANQAQGRDTELLEDLLASAAESVDDIELRIVRANMLLIIGRSYFLIFDYETAIETMTKAIAIYETLDSESLHDHVSAKKILADSLRNTGETEIVIEILDDSIAMLDAHDNPEQRMNILIVKSETIMGMGDWTAALEAVEQAQSVAKDASIQTSPGLDMLNGMLLRRLKRYDEAEALYNTALEKYKAADDQIQVSKTYNAFALLAKNQGNYEDAEAWYRQSIDLRQSIDSRPNPSTAISTANLGRLLAEQNRYEEAIPILEQSVQLHRELYGETHFARGFPTASIARAKSELGQHEEAIALINTALDLFRAQFGDLHPAIAIALSDKGLFLIRTERFLQAQSCLEESLEIVHEMNLDPVTFEIQPRERLADALDKQGLHSQAIEHLQAAYWILEDQSSPAAVRIKKHLDLIQTESE